MKHLYLLIILLFLAGLLTACGGQDSAPEVANIATATAVPAIPTETNTPEPTATNTAVPTDTPEPIPTDEPNISSGTFDEIELDNGWIKYTLPEEQVAIAFPPDWTVVKLSSKFLEDALNSVGENNEGALSTLSTDAVQSMAAAGIKLMGLDTDPDAITRDTPTTANILILELPIELTFDSWVEINLTQLKALANEGIIESEIIKINGTQAAKISYVADLVTALGVPDTVRIEQYLFKQDNMTYIVTLASQVEIADRYTELFPEIAKTFELLGTKD